MATQMTLKRYNGQTWEELYPVTSYTILQNKPTFTNNAPTLAWGNTATIGTVGGTPLTVTMPANPAASKANSASPVFTGTITASNAILIGTSGYLYVTKTSFESSPPSGSTGQVLFVIQDL